MLLQAKSPKAPGGTPPADITPSASVAATDTPDPTDASTPSCLPDHDTHDDQGDTQALAPEASEETGGPAAAEDDKRVAFASDEEDTEEYDEEDEDDDDDDEDYSDSEVDEEDEEDEDCVDPDDFPQDDGPLPPPKKVPRSKEVEAVYHAAIRMVMMAGKAPSGETAKLLTPPRINSADKMGSALTEAIQWNNTEALQALISRKANVDQKSAGGITALMRAAKCSSKPLMELLLAASAAVDHVDRDKNTALMLAASMNAVTAVHTLVTARANVNLRNDAGDSALMIAAYNNSRGCVQALLRHPGVDLELRDNTGRTALLSAARFADQALIDALLARGARKDAVDQDGNSFDGIMGERSNS